MLFCKVRIRVMAVLKLWKKKWGNSNKRGGAEIETPKALRGRDLGRWCSPPQPTWLVQSVCPRVARCPVFDRTVRFFGDLSGQKYDAKPDS